MTRSPTHEAALEYARRGWYVFPLQPGMKTPLAGTRGHLDATVDPQQIDAIWSGNPNYNLGIAVAPSGLTVLDIDVSEKKDGTLKRGAESLAEINDHLAPSLLAMTGRGGTHVIYARPPDVEAKRVIGFMEGLDLIGDGYIVAAPSFLSETGRYYQWTQASPIAPLPAFLQHVTRAQRTTTTVAEPGAAIVEGNRNNALYKLGAALRDTGVSREALTRALDVTNRERFKPPVDDAELIQIVDSVMRRVEVKRDVAAGAIVEQEIQQIFAPQSRSIRLADVALVPLVPQAFYSTGFDELDKMLRGGFATQQLTGVIGPPSTGKSALIGHWLLLLSKHRPVLHCSLELLRHELYVRYAAHELEFPWSDGMRGQVDNTRMANAVKDVNIRLIGADDVDDNDPLGSILAEAQRIKDECGIAPIIAIDYIQIMADSAGDKVRQKVGELAKRCRRAAQTLDTVIIGVFTTQRTSYAGKDAERMRGVDNPRAYLAAAKESGDIEYHCATLMYLDVETLGDHPEKPARIAVARCRQGSEGFVGIKARLDIGKFWSDASVLTQFTKEALQARRDDSSLEGNCARLLTVIDAMPGACIGDIQKESKLSGTAWSKARSKLLDDKVIFEDTDVRENGRRVPNAKTLRRRIAESAPALPPEEDTP